MGKRLIIKGADFSENAIDGRTYIPLAVQSENKSITYFANSVTSLQDDVNELGGKTLVGFDLIFDNFANNLPLSIAITFGSDIVCDITCNFSEGETEKLVHYDLSTPYTFNDYDTIHTRLYGNYALVDGVYRCGCRVYRVSRPDNVPNYSFKVSKYPSAYQPFVKLYLK